MIPSRSWAPLLALCTWLLAAFAMFVPRPAARRG